MSVDRARSALNFVPNFGPFGKNSLWNGPKETVVKSSTSCKLMD